MIEVMQQCPCKSHQSYRDCCQPLLKHERNAVSPEALMRSRYTAYTQANFEYIEQTMRGKPLAAFNKVEAVRAAQETEWLGLTVLHATDTDPDAQTGFVEFIAKYRYCNKDYCLHECSEFHKIDGKWFYVAGKQPKIGRNDICPCGSGKKYKHCCQP